MGAYWSSNHWSIEHFTLPHLRKDNFPHPHKESPYDPMYGFESRPQRGKCYYHAFKCIPIDIKLCWFLVMVATEAEMDSAKLQPPDRDYCAHHFITLKACFDKNMPLVWRCKHEKHAFHECEFNDMVLRMKEWERERRLNEREKKRAKAQLDVE